MSLNKKKKTKKKHKTKKKNTFFCSANVYSIILKLYVSAGFAKMLIAITSFFCILFRFYSPREFFSYFIYIYSMIDNILFKIFIGFYCALSL